MEEIENSNKNIDTIEDIYMSPKASWNKVKNIIHEIISLITKIKENTDLSHNSIEDICHSSKISWNRVINLLPNVSKLIINIKDQPRYPCLPQGIMKDLITARRENIIDLEMTVQSLDILMHRANNGPNNERILQKRAELRLFQKAKEDIDLRISIEQSNNKMYMDEFLKESLTGIIMPEMPRQQRTNIDRIIITALRQWQDRVIAMEEEYQLLPIDAPRIPEYVLQSIYWTIKRNRERRDENRKN